MVTGVELHLSPAEMSDGCPQSSEHQQLLARTSESNSRNHRRIAVAVNAALVIAPTEPADSSSAQPAPELVANSPQCSTLPMPTVVEAVGGAVRVEQVDEQAVGLVLAAESRSSVA